MNEAELILFLKKAAEVAPRYYPLFLCASHTGMRSGELAALKWSDIDFNGNFIVVRASVSHGKEGRTKTGKRRKIDMSDALKSTLIQLKEERTKRFHGKVPEHVFCNQHGRRIDMHNVKVRHFHHCLELAKLRRIRFHDLRHTFATLLIMRSESMAYVKDQLGHSNITLTVNTYTHWILGSNRQGSQRASNPCTCGPASG